MQSYLHLASLLIVFLFGAQALDLNSPERRRSSSRTPERPAHRQHVGSFASTHFNPSWSSSPPPSYEEQEHRTAEPFLQAKAPGAPRRQRFQTGRGSSRDGQGSPSRQQRRSTPTRPSRPESLMSRMTLGQGPMYTSQQRSPSPVLEDEHLGFSSDSARLLALYRSPLVDNTPQVRDEEKPTYAEAQNASLLPDFGPEELESDDHTTHSMTADTDPTSYDDMNSLISCAEDSSGAAIYRPPADVFGDRVKIAGAFRQGNAS